MQKTSTKKIKYRLLDSFGILLFPPLALIFRWLSPQSLIFLARVLGTLAYYLIKKYRERVLSNLSIAFQKGKDQKEIKTLAKEVFFNFTLTPLETIYAYVNPLDRFLLKIKINGKEHLDAALAQGKGVIALGIHSGPFTLVGGRLSIEGYPFNLIINEGNFPKVWKKLGDYQRRLGQKPFALKPIPVSIKKSLNCLHRNEILYLIADEQQRRGGIPVPFFGQMAYTPPGPAIFSLKTGAPLLLVFIVREKGIPQTLFIEKPIDIDRTTEMQSDIKRLTIRFTKAIEDAIRRYPSQWPWLNRRWKLPEKGLLDMGKQEG